MLSSKSAVADLAHRSRWSALGQYPAFRLLQEQVVERLLVKRKSALVLFPTGGGKSLCFQGPSHPSPASAHQPG